MLNPYPSFCYRLPFPGSKPQGVHGSERPGAAMLAAYASFLRGEAITGAGRKLTRDQLLGVFQSAASTIGIPWARMHLWCQGINGVALTSLNTEHFQAVNALPICGLTPSPYQITAAGRLTIAGGTLAMGVGLGKTLTTMVAARALVDGQVIADKSRCWVVCPLSAFPAWGRYKTFLATYFGDVKVISVDSAHKLRGADRKAGGLLIVDEAHYAGHGTARRTKAMQEIRLAFDACICLTGTLLHSGIEAATNVLDLSIPGSTGFATKWTAAEYFQCIERVELSSGRKVAKVVKPAGQWREKFISFVSRYVVAMTKESPEVRNDITIPEQHLHLENLDGDDTEAESAAVDCLVRIAEDIIAAGGTIPHAKELSHLALREGAAEKLEWLWDQMADNEEPVAVFAEYHETLDRAEVFFKEKGISYVRVDGSVTGELRAQAVRDFQAGKLRVFLGQIDATGLSIDLFRAFISVALDHTQRAANYAQMLGRTCRRGQTEECHHFDLAANAVQRICISRLRAGEDFNQSLSTYQAAISRLNTKGMP